MYKYTRQEAAELLGISTRSIDRYIKSGKLRSKKDGKIVYVKGSDVDTLLGGGKTQEVIVPKKPKEEKTIITKKQTESSPMLETIYSDLKNEIKNKDNTIQELSQKLGRVEEIAKNSVSLIEFKKSQFLLEESKGHLGHKVDELKKSKEQLKSELKYEKTTNLILIIFVLVLLVVAAAVWFYNI
ncbi:MAG: helix-turn-helix domain-containing protein [Candidatus Gracilibacteria bacterium]|nr:helix-turn-helix domain-containing protein [Candidatus Gracilibacteria bacterium]